MKVWVRGQLKSVILRKKRNRDEMFGVLQIETEENGRYSISDFISTEEMARQLKDLVGQSLEIPINVYAKGDQLRVFIAGEPVMI